jgi:Fur family ferric uptake transcriptional regulator
MSDTTDEGVASELERFIGFLRRRGFKITQERLDVLREINAIDGHFEAEDLFIRLRQQGNSVSKATIYRTLPLLLESGLVRQSFLTGEKQTYYEHTLGPKRHEHLICTRCGKVIEFTSPHLEAALATVYEDYRFLAEKRRVEIYGTCADCMSFLQ